VPADVLPDDDRAAGLVEEPRRVQPPRRVEHPLLGTQPVRQAEEYGGRHPQLRPARRAGHLAEGQHVVDALGAADPAGRRGGGETRVALGGSSSRGTTELDGHDVELLLGSQPDVGAVGHLVQVLGGGQHAFTEEEAGRELEVVPGSPHGDRHALGRAARPGQPDLQRLLGRQPVLVADDGRVRVGR
jgi:hypothetical protein